MPLQGTLSHSGEGLTNLVRQCSTKLFLNSPLYFIPATLDWSNFDLLPYFRFKILSYNAPQPSTEIVTPLGEIISRRGEMASRHWEIVNHPGNIFLYLHVPNTLQFVTSTVVFKLQQWLWSRSNVALIQSFLLKQLSSVQKITVPVAGILMGLNKISKTTAYYEDDNLGD
jgi:hypothetical protein